MESLLNSQIDSAINKPLQHFAIGACVCFRCFIIVDSKIIGSKGKMYYMNFLLLQGIQLSCAELHNMYCVVSGEKEKSYGKEV